MTDAQAYYLMMAISAVKRAVYRIALDLDDEPTFKRVMGEIEMCERALEQAGLHLVKEEE